MRRYLIFILFVVIGCTSRSEKNSFRLGDFKMKSLDGKSLDMSSLEGKTVFINVWATWCKPCIQEMPTIAKAMEISRKPRHSNMISLNCNARPSFSPSKERNAMTG